MRKLGLLLCVVFGLLGGFVAPAAGYTFTVTDETPDGSFGTATLVGSQSIEFNSPNQSATASGGGLDAPNALLNLTITAGAGETIDEIWLRELGSILFGGTGTDATNVMLAMSGTFTVTATTGGPFAGSPIAFGGFGDPSFPVSTPGSLVFPGYGMSGGSTSFESVQLIDVESFVPNATQVTLAFNNTLVAFSELGSSVTIEKDSIKINVVPEPGTFALFCGGLLALGIRARRQRS